MPLLQDLRLRLVLLLIKRAKYSNRIYVFSCIVYSKDRLRLIHSSQGNEYPQQVHSELAILRRTRSFIICSLLSKASISFNIFWWRAHATRGYLSLCGKYFLGRLLFSLFLFSFLGTLLGLKSSKQGPCSASYLPFSYALPS